MAQITQCSDGVTVVVVGTTLASALSGSLPAATVPVPALSATGSPSSSTYLRGDGSWTTPAGAGTVTSVAMTGDGVIFNSSITGSPITGAGTLVPVLLTQAKNTSLMGPASGANAAPTFRQPTFSDISGATINAQLPNGVSNFNSAIQSLTVVSGTAVYITSSNINIPASPVVGLVVGTTFKWRVVMTKSAAGTGIFQFVIFRGTNGTTGDTADVTQTIGTQTAINDNMVVDVTVVIKTIGATGSYFWTICPLAKAATATGFGAIIGPSGQFTGTVSSVNLTTASLKFGLGFICTTGTPVVAIPYVSAEAFNLV